VQLTVENMPWKKYRRLASRPSDIGLQYNRSCPMCCDASSSALSSASPSAPVSAAPEPPPDKTLLSIDDFQFYEDLDGKNRVVHRIVACGGCGFVYTNPCYTPEGFARLFEKAGKSYGHSEGRCQEQAAWLQQHVLDIESVLDIGCGSGAFLKALPRGVQRYGIDIDSGSIDYADEENTGIHFSLGDFSSAFSPHGANHNAIPDVAVITLFHVLEHLPDPKKTLVNLRAQCRDNASLVVEVPVIDRAAAEQNKDIVGFYTIQHLSHFSKASLHAMLACSGWQVTFSEDIRDYNGYRVLAVAGGAVSETVSNPARQRDMAATHDYLAQWRNNVTQVDGTLASLYASLATETNIIIWGAGQHTEYLCHLSRIFNNTRRFIIVDSDPLKQGTAFHGIAVLAPDAIPQQLWCTGKEPIVISSFGGQPQIVQQLLQRGVAPSRIISLYTKPNVY